MPAAIIEISQDLMDAARLSAAEIKQELALTLYAGRRLSLAKARELAGLSLWEFRQLLRLRRIAPHFHDDDLSTCSDCATIPGGIKIIDIAESFGYTCLQITALSSLSGISGSGGIG